MMLPARLGVRLAGTVVGTVAALACGFADVFRPAGPEAVTIVYVGDSILHRDSTVPFSVVVQAGGTQLDRPHLTMWSSDTSVFDLNSERDSLAAQAPRPPRPPPRRARPLRGAAVRCLRGAGGVPPPARFCGYCGTLVGDPH